MCIVSAPAKLTGTLIAAGIAERGDHYLVYQNQAEISSDASAAMLLAIPSTGPLSRENFIDFSKSPQVLVDSWPRFEVARRNSTRATGHGVKAVDFYSGNYRIFAAQSLSDIQEALRGTEYAQKIKISEAMADFFHTSYPGWSLALCCFNNRELQLMDPIGIIYDSLFPDHIYIPGVDAHDGNPPQLDTYVARDHRLMIGAFDMTQGVEMTLPGIGSIRSLGVKLKNFGPNGDFVVPKADLLAASRSRVLPSRAFHTVTPPGIAKSGWRNLLNNETPPLSLAERPMEEGLPPNFNPRDYLWLENNLERLGAAVLRGLGCDFLDPTFIPEHIPIKSLPCIGTSWELSIYNDEPKDRWLLMFQWNPDTQQFEAWGSSHDSVQLPSASQWSSGSFKEETPDKYLMLVMSFRKNPKELPPIKLLARETIAALDPEAFNWFVMDATKNYTGR
ncbi:MAG: hypothetical protein IPJ69_07985 [Deltaproteobacteria bacterium]|nr:MAG: hypothetical protein IPJ69_07985 [Deltaproteobacteria bacterium]